MPEAELSTFFTWQPGEGVVPSTRYMLVDDSAREVFEGWLEFAGSTPIRGIAHVPEWPEGAQVKKVTLPCLTARTHAYAITAKFWRSTPDTRRTWCSCPWRALPPEGPHIFWQPDFMRDGIRHPFTLAVRAFTRMEERDEQAG